MSRASGVPLEQLRPHLFLLRDRDATSHLLRVSGGLDSLVMGEGQILAQVKQVHKVGQNCPGFGRHLNGLFKQAVTAGKRVRTETSISSGAVSVSSAAAELAQLKLPTHDFNDAKVRCGGGWGVEGVGGGGEGPRPPPQLPDSCCASAAGRLVQPQANRPATPSAAALLLQVCIIGAGKMSRLLVKHMHSKGCTRMTILNRRWARGAVRGGLGQSKSPLCRDAASSLWASLLPCPPLLFLTSRPPPPLSLQPAARRGPG